MNELMVAESRIRELEKQVAVLCSALSSYMYVAGFLLTAPFLVMVMMENGDDSSVLVNLLLLACFFGLPFLVAEIAKSRFKKKHGIIIR